MKENLIPPITIPRRKRRAAPKWQAVFNAACELKPYQFNKGFGYSEILTLAEEQGISIARESLRVKIERYRRQGYVEKISRGRYQILPKGYEFFGAL